jgi:hypothetical protein
VPTGRTGELAQALRRAGVAEAALLPAVRAAPPGRGRPGRRFSCRTQLDHLAGRRALHLAQLLAGAQAEQEEPNAGR